MAKPLIKEKAQKLRKSGKSIGEVAKELCQPKSTVSYWCKDILLTEKQILAIQKRHKSSSVETLLKSSEKQRRRRLDNEKIDKELGQKRVGTVSNRDLFMLGLGLYWGEGYKYKHAEFGFTNSDPNMIVVYIQWLKMVFGVNVKDLLLRVSINIAHKNRISKIEQFWQKVTDTTPEQFSRPSYIKTNQKKKFSDNSSYFGTLRVKVRGGKRKKNEILAAIDHFSKRYQ